DVSDGVDGIFYVLEHSNEPKNVFNLGHDAFLNVLDLADIVVDQLNLKRVRYVTTGGERGWLGDSPFVHLDTTKLKALGWRPHVSRWHYLDLASAFFVLHAIGALGILSRLYYGEFQDGHTTTTTTTTALAAALNLGFVLACLALFLGRIRTTKSIGTGELLAI